MRRALLVTVTVVLAASCIVSAAFAAPPDDAKAAAQQFIDALQKQDASGTCSLFSARVLTLLGGQDKCTKVFSEGVPDGGTDGSVGGDIGDGQDEISNDILAAVFDDARAIGLGRDGYVTKRAKLARLVRELQTLEPALTFSIGRGAQAARGAKFTHVVVDPRTSSRTLLLYEESDSGTIWQLSARGFTRAAINNAGQGTPANPAPANPTEPPTPEGPVTITITGAAQLDDTSVFVVMTEQYENTKLSFVLSMKLENGAWKVDDLLIPLFSILEATAQGN